MHKRARASFINHCFDKALKLPEIVGIQLISCMTFGGQFSLAAV